MSGFLIILGLFLLAFASTQAILNTSSAAENYADLDFMSLISSLGTEWLVMFGEFGDKTPMEANNSVEPVIFVVATAILPMILLNLVIAIMSDTYEKVITSIDESDNKQKNSIILQFENYMVWRRFMSDDKPKHLFWYEYSTGGAYQWVSQVDHIISEI